MAETNGATNTIAGLGFNTVNRILSGTYGAKGHYESTYYRQYFNGSYTQISSTPVVVTSHNNRPTVNGTVVIPTPFNFTVNRTNTYSFPSAGNANSFTDYFLDDNPISDLIF